jgi:hypothetical protein
MKRIIGAAVAGVLAFSGIYALAASLNVASQPVGAGTATISAGCTADTLQVSYSAFVYSSTNGETVTKVAVTDTNGSPTLTACEGLPYELDVTGTGGASLASVSGNLAASFTGGAVLPATAFTAGTDMAGVPAASITGVSLVIG